MRKHLKILGSLLIVISCSESTDFVFDDSKTNRIVRYEYSYKNNLKVSATEIHYSLIDLDKVDSSIYIEKYKYDSSDKLILKERLDTYDNSIEKEGYRYEQDSLIFEFSINSTNDTVRYCRYHLYPDRKRLVEERQLFERPPGSGDFLDTIHYFLEYEFKDGKIIKDKEFVKRFLVSSRDYIYDSYGRLIQSQQIRNNRLIPDYIIYYDIPAKNAVYESLMLTPQNDTISFIRHDYVNDNVSSTTLMYDEGKQLHKSFFNSKGQLIGEISIAYEANYKKMSKYDYYPNGDLKEEHIQNRSIYEH